LSVGMDCGVNEYLGAKESSPARGYEVQPGDIYLQELRPGQWNLHRYVAGVWEYQTVLTEAEADRFVSVMHLACRCETDEKIRRTI